MPGLVLNLSGPADRALARRIVPALTELTCSILDKKIAETMCIVKFVAAEDWFIGGATLAELGRKSFRLEVTITDETSTKSQKAAYQKGAFAMLAELIGNVHPHSNVHVIDCRASAYGYGGVTQEYRHQHEAGR
jgi:4-oxalocrotonate tautomerase